MSIEQQRGQLGRRSVQRPASSDAQIAALRYEVAGLRRAIATQGPIEQAKGMLMMRYGCSQGMAFDMLARWSSERNVKVRIVALTLVGIFTGDDSAIDARVAPDKLLSQMLSGSGCRATSTSMSAALENQADATLHNEATGSLVLVCRVLASDAGQGVDVAVAEAVAGALEVEDVGVVDDAVVHVGDGLVAEDAAPAGERQVAGQDE